MLVELISDAKVLATSWNMTFNSMFLFNMITQSTYSFVAVLAEAGPVMIIFKVFLIFFQRVKTFTLPRIADIADKSGYICLRTLFGFLTLN